MGVMILKDHLFPAVIGPGEIRVVGQIGVKTLHLDLGGVLQCDLSAVGADHQHGVPFPKQPLTVMAAATDENPLGKEVVPNFLIGALVASSVRIGTGLQIVNHNGVPPFCSMRWDTPEVYCLSIFIIQHLNLSVKWITHNSAEATKREVGI